VQKTTEIQLWTARWRSRRLDLQPLMARFPQLCRLGAFTTTQSVQYSPSRSTRFTMYGTSHSGQRAKVSSNPWARAVTRNTACSKLIPCDFPPSVATGGEERALLRRLATRPGYGTVGFVQITAIEFGISVQVARDLTAAPEAARSIPGSFFKPLLDQAH
jgi:hypothetical protein